MKLNILLIEDDIINRKLIKTMLSHHKDIINKIYEASNGKEALHMLEEHEDINFILLDILMPIMDGREFLKIFRSQKKFSNTPVVILTTDDSKKSEILNIGADDIIIKPVKEEELIKRIKYWIQ